MFTDRVISGLPIMRQTRQDPEMSVFDLSDCSSVCFCIVVLIELTLRRLMSYIYGAPILDVSRSHTTTQHSR